MNTVSIVFFILSAALALSLARFIIGPTLPDRVIALDSMAMISLGIIALHSIDRNSPDFLDVGILVAFVSFLGTVAFALYIEKKAP
jgi:multicomponent Na+:H+ antiporter subunit F